MVNWTLRLLWNLRHLLCQDRASYAYNRPVVNKPPFLGYSVQQITYILWPLKLLQDRENQQETRKQVTSWFNLKSFPVIPCDQKLKYEVREDCDNVTVESLPVQALVYAQERIAPSYC